MPIISRSSYTINFPDTHYQQVLKKCKGNKTNAYKGTKRVIKMFILCALLPAIFLTVPLYLRFRVYIQQFYPVGMSDMRIIDSKISTTWCQSQLIHANTTFNAYVVSAEPEISNKIEKIEMRRNLLLKDGMKEYWGFYLLKGSSFTVSSCVRWPGASLIIIEGHRNLKECAYVGDNSSEETDISVSSEEDRNVTAISQMTKIASEMILNDWNHILHSAAAAAATSRSNSNETNSTAAAERKHLPRTNFKRQNVHLKYAEELYLKETQKKSADQHAKGKNSTSKPPTHSEEILSDIVTKLDQLGPRGKQIIHSLKNGIDQEYATRGTAKPTNESENSEFVDKAAQDVSKMSAVEDGGNDQFLSKILDQVERLLAKDLLSKKNRSVGANRNVTETQEEQEFKNIRKEILFHRMQQLNLLNTNNETNSAAEVVDDTDKADMHGSVKTSKHGDRSKSEYWSSFSSSEERLLECKGLLVSLPLIPYSTCEHTTSTSNLDGIAKINSISYTVKSNGYYFFIFNNENEVKNNFIHARFQINKTVYNISSAVASCKNESKECQLPLSFWSKEKTILQLPSPSDDSLWNEEFIFISKCEPRSALYLICFMSIPLCLLLFAFT